MLSLCLLVIYGIGGILANDYQCTADVRPPGCSTTCQQRAMWNQCGQDWMHGYCCSSCAEACDDQCTNAKYDCHCDIPPNIKYTCSQIASYGLCNSYWFSIEGYCCESCPGSCSDQCADPTTPKPTPAPTPIPTPAPTCDASVRIRRPWNEISQEERDLYITGFKTLADQGIMQILSQTHWDSADHGFFAFLPWHRAIVMVVEDAIRALGGEYACFAMPYWDWSHEPTPYEVVYNEEELVIMNSGIGNDSLGQCQNSGSPFDVNEYITQAPWFTNDEGTRCLQRNMNYESEADTGGFGICWFTSPAELIDGIGSTNIYDEFDGWLEGFPHAAPHVCIFNNMATFYSPDDPAFYLHHSYVDYIWAVWQDCWDYDGIEADDPDFVVETMFDARPGALDHVLEFTPYSDITFTPRDMLDLSKYGVMYEEGPFFLNADVHNNGNCTGTINPNWFIPSDPVYGYRRLQDKQTISFNPVRGDVGDVSSVQQVQLRSSQSGEMEIEVEMCSYGRTACPLPEEFEDCSDTDNWPINSETGDIDITLDELLNMEGINECQKAHRIDMYNYAKNFHYLRRLCNGCMGQFCDQRALLKKCALDSYYVPNDRGSSAVSSIAGSKENNNKSPMDMILNDKAILIYMVVIVVSLTLLCNFILSQCMNSKGYNQITKKSVNYV